MNTNSQYHGSGAQTGGCLCGAIRYETTGQPFWVGYCHCESCRKSTGAPVVLFAGYKLDQAKFTKGERRFYRSSPGATRSFCGDCGTPLTWEGKSSFEGRGDIIEFYISTFDDAEVFRPENHSWLDDKISWFEVADHLPRYHGFDFNSARYPDKL